MNCQKVMTLPLKEEEASRLDPKAKVKATQVVSPTNLDVNGVLGAIIHGPPNKRPANSTSGSSSSSSSAKTKGTYQCRTTLGDRRVVETRVLVRNQNKPVSKHRRTELNVEEDDEVHQEQEDDMSSLLEASVGIQLFQDNTQHDDGYADNWDDGAEADIHVVFIRTIRFIRTNNTAEG
jgi:hypothetical protein